MKRSISASNVIASSENNWMQTLTDYFVERIESELYHADYEVKGIGVLPNLRLVVTYTGDDPEYAPELELTVREYERGAFDVMPRLTFPVLDQNDFDYFDSIHYRISNWERIGAYLSRLNALTFKPDEYDPEDF